MGKLKVIISYTSLPEGELDNFAQTVCDKLTGNANFTLGASDLTTLQALIDSYAARYEASRDGTKADTLAKNNARKALLDQLRMLAETVNLQANGDEAKLLSSGFTLPQKRSKIGVFPKPEWLKATAGNNSGEVLLEMEANEDADMYLFFVALAPGPDDVNDWRQIPSKKSKLNASGFTPGKEYVMKCAFKGSKEALVYSNTIRFFAQ